MESLTRSVARQAQGHKIVVQKITLTVPTPGAVQVVLTALGKVSQDRLCPGHHNQVPDKKGIATVSP